MDYSDFILPNTPETIVYIPNFITSEEEQHIIKSVDAAPKPKWIQLLNRRLINYGGIPHPNGMIAEEIPMWLKVYLEKINGLGIFDLKKANHCLINEYLAGQGIMAHTDGPLFYPTVSTISCGSHTVLEFYKRMPNDVESLATISNKNLVLKILLEPRSLILLKDHMYTNHLHQISELTEDVIDDRVCNLPNCETEYKIGEKLKRNRRISLTIRHVPKTSKMKLKIGISGIPQFLELRRKYDATTASNFLQRKLKRRNESCVLPCFK